MSPTGADGETTKTVLASVPATTRNRATLPYASQEDKGKPLVKVREQPRALVCVSGGYEPLRLGSTAVREVQISYC